MNLKKVGSKIFTINLLADFILSKIPQEEQTIIKVVDCVNFFIIKGKTTYKEVLDFSSLVSQFQSEHTGVIDNTKITHTIDLIEYGVKLAPQTEIQQTYHFSDNCSYTQKQIDLFEKNKSSYTDEYIPKEIVDDEMVLISEFPHGYSLGQGRLLYYYGKHIFYSIPLSNLSQPLIFKLTTLRNDEGENLSKIYNTYINTEEDERLTSAVLDVFDFDMCWLEKEMKKADWSVELTNPLEEHPVIKKKNPDLILT